MALNVELIDICYLWVLSKQLCYIFFICLSCFSHNSMPWGNLVFDTPNHKTGYTKKLSIQNLHLMRVYCEA